MDYSELSDFEINGYVEALICGFDSFEFVGSKNGLIRGSTTSSYGFTESMAGDYCNDPSEAWGIIVENSISIIKYDHIQWRARSRGKITGVIDKNPLRAAMIVYLMMNESDGKQ